MKIKLLRVWAIVCLICVAVSCSTVMAQAAGTDYGPYPQPDTGYVTDLANLLTDEQETQLEKWLYDCEQENGFEMAVVTIGSIADYPGTDNGSIEAFASGLFDRYGVGNMPKNDGVLLLVAVKDREVRIELGEGHERSRDRDASRIMQNTIIPQFRNGRYDMGILEAAQSILLTFAGKDVTGGSEVPLPQAAAPVQEAPTSVPMQKVVPAQKMPSGYTPRPVQNYRPGRKSVGFGGTAFITILFIVGLVVMVLLIALRGVTNRGFAAGNYGTNSMIGQDGSGIVPNDGYNRGFLSGLFAGGMGHRGLHNGGIHFGGRSSRHHGIGFGGMSSHNHGIGFGSRHSAGGFGGGFGGGFSGGSHRSSFGGGFSRGGGATGKW